MMAMMAAAAGNGGGRKMGFLFVAGGFLSFRVWGFRVYVLGF